MTESPQPKQENQVESLMHIYDKTVPFGDDRGIREAFDEHGFCIVTDILRQLECEHMLNELWTSKRLLGTFDRNNPSTWSSLEWPQQDGGRNFLASSNVYQDAASWDLISCGRLLHVQKLLWGHDNLIASALGRWGVMRPSRRHPEWRTESSWLHCDQNCWTQPGFSAVQCIVCLTDGTPTSGGFACVPGFQKRYRAWGQEHPPGSLVVNGKVVNEFHGDEQPFPVPQDDPCQQQVVRVVAPAGAAILWDSRLPHQNFPNTDDQAFRVVHYTNVTVRTEETEQASRRVLHQKRILMDLLGEEGPRFPHHLSPTGRWIHGLEPEPVSLEEALREFRVDEPNSLREAVKLVQEAGQLEEQGDIAAAVSRN